MKRRMIKLISIVLVLTLPLVAEVTKADFTVGEPTNLGPTVNSSAGDTSPSISADGLELYFSSDRPGGYGLDDIYVMTRATTEDDWGEPVNLGPLVNSSTADI
ncbi:MAG: TolB family protein, partial [Planctomycetota bacterium]